MIKPNTIKKEWHGCHSKNHNKPYATSFRGFHSFKRNLPTSNLQEAAKKFWNLWKQGTQFGKVGNRKVYCLTIHANYQTKNVD